MFIYMYLSYISFEEKEGWLVIFSPLDLVRPSESRSPAACPCRTADCRTPCCRTQRWGSRAGPTRAVLNEKNKSRPQPKCRKKETGARARRNFFDRGVFSGTGENGENSKSGPVLKMAVLIGKKKSHPLRTANEAPTAATRGQASP